MAAVDPRLASALVEQQRARRAVLEGGATRVGWKLGLGEREKIAGQQVIGYLTSQTCLPSGDAYVAIDPDRLHADAEVAVALAGGVDADAGDDAVREAVVGFAAAVEVVDLGGTDDAEGVVAQNVWHRAVAFGPFSASLPAPAQARLLVDGQVRGDGTAAAFAELACRIRTVARLLAVVGERLEAGDRIITGSVVQVAVHPGEDVIAEIDELGRARLAITA